MDIGIIIGIITIIIALVFNYINLYTMYEYNNERVKHWVISYYVSWIIALIPIYGIIHELIWFIVQLGICEYNCKAKIFQNV